MRFAVAILLLAAGGYVFWQQTADGPASEGPGMRRAAPVTVVEVSRQSFRDRIPALLGVHRHFIVGVPDHRIPEL